MDVSLALISSNLTEVVDELESRLQQILGPRLADCSARRRLRAGWEESERRFLIRKHVVANALFDSEYQPNQSCISGAPQPCIRVLTRVNLILKGDEPTLELVILIDNIIGIGEAN